MPDIYLIGDTIRFTASIVNLDGVSYDPDVVTVSIFSADGTELLENAEAVKKSAGSYYYDWKVQGVTDKEDLIVIWDWSGLHKKRLKFTVIPETE
jgi:hypothetical protein